MKELKQDKCGRYNGLKPCGKKAEFHLCLECQSNVIEEVTKSAKSRLLSELEEFSEKMLSNNTYNLEVCKTCKFKAPQCESCFKEMGKGNMIFLFKQELQKLKELGEYGNWPKRLHARIMDI